MTNHESFLHGIQIATPCHVSWDSMTGDERTRHCHSCQLSVYNIASMSTAEAEKLIVESEGRLCLRIFRRSDGRVITKDCPKGLRAIRDRYFRCAAGAAALVSVCAMYVMNKPTGSLQRYATKLHATAEAIHTKYAPSGVAGGMSMMTPPLEKTCQIKGEMSPSAAVAALRKIEAVKKGIKHD